MRWPSCFKDEPDLLIAARKGSPLAVGHGDKEMYLGSDAVALAPFTDRITYLEDGDHAVLTRAGVQIWDAEGHQVHRATARIDVGATVIDRAGHRHFMAKEIAEQPAVIGDVLNHYVKGDRIVLPDGLDFANLDRVTLVGCGTAHLAGHVAKYWFEQLAGLPCDIDVASEFRYREPPLSDRSLFIAVSQSGETADTLAALHYARGKVARTVGLVNVGTSAIARDADMALPTLAGIEVSVASSKAFTCQLAVLAVLALKAAHDRGRLDDAALTAHLRDLRAIPALLAQALALSDDCREQADWLAQARDVLYLGRGALYPVALEGALKLKELSYIHAEGYASGELKHGPIALIDGDVPVVVLAPHDALFDKTISNMQEVMARHGQVLLISDAAGIAAAGDGITASLARPPAAVCSSRSSSMPCRCSTLPITAVAKGTDVDQPATWPSPSPWNEKGPLRRAFLQTAKGHVMGRTPLAQGLLLVTGADPVVPCDSGVVERLEPGGRYLLAGLTDIVRDVAGDAKDPAGAHHAGQGAQVFGRHEPPPMVARLGPGIRIHQEGALDAGIGQHIHQVARRPGGR